MRFPKTTITVLAFVCGGFMAIPAAQAQTTWYVDDDCTPPGAGTEADPFCLIQDCIDAAMDGDQCVVAPGAYFENIRLLGKAITLRSTDPSDPVVVAATIIDAADNGTVVTCDSDEGPDTVLDGFTITGGSVLDGGGMFNQNSSPTVTNCTFSGSTAVFGGGMYNSGGSPTVINCTFSGNTAGILGGGMFNISGSSPTVINCTFSGNTSDSNGGGMFNGNDSSPMVTNCTFSGNTAVVGGGMINNNDSCPMVTNCKFSGNTAVIGGGMHNANGSSPPVINCTFSGNTAVIGGGIYNGYDSSPTVTNCILWNDNPIEISNEATVSYCDVEGGFAGVGNIDADPLFFASGFWDDNGTPGIPEDDFWVEGDYHLSAGSPCIDAGDNTAVPEGIVSDLDGNPRFVDDPDTDDMGFGDPPIVDMGAYEVQDLCVDDDGDGRITICHIPPGNPDKAHTITVNENAVPAHLAHGDYCGPCEGGLSADLGAGGILGAQGKPNTRGSAPPVLRERGS